MDRIRFTDLAVGEKPERELQFLFALSRTSYETPPSVDVTVRLRMAPAPPTTSSFALELSVTGRFETIEDSANMDLKEFAKANGPALVMPFVREIVANITARSRNGIVLMPPINVVMLAERQAEALAGEDL